jgi:hypothetical protein
VAVGLFLITASVALLWSSAKNKDLRDAIPLFVRGKDPNDAKPISKPLPSDEPMGFSDTTGSLNLGGRVTWTKQRVFVYTLAIAKAFGITAGGQCRQDGVVPPYGSATSLHFVSNGCRARDFFGSDEKLKRAERWAKAQGGAFAEVLYTGVPGHGPGMGGTRHFHLGFPKEGPMPIIPGSQSGGGSGGGSF